MSTQVEKDPAIVIRNVEPGDRLAWESLFQGYARFYQLPMNEEILSRCWSWLLAPDHPEEGIVATLPNGELVGLVHFRSVPETLLARESGFLDDLFVSDAHRGRGVGRGLIAAVAKIAQERGWSALRWITAQDNAQAQLLYDDMAEKTAWLTYELNLPAEPTPL